MPDSELDRIDPQPKVITLQSGLEVQVVRIRTRQFFRLLKILTAAGPEILSTLNFQDEDFGVRLMAVLLFALPEAESPAVEFIQSMVRPHGLHALPRKPKKGQKLSDEQVAENQAKWDQINDDLFNPQLEDTIDILETVIRQEAPEIQALGKRLGALLSEVTKALPGTTPDQETPEPETQTGEQEKTGS